MPRDAVSVGVNTKQAAVRCKQLRDCGEEVFIESVALLIVSKTGEHSRLWHLIKLHGEISTRLLNCKEYPIYISMLYIIYRYIEIYIPIYRDIFRDRRCMYSAHE